MISGLRTFRVSELVVGETFPVRPGGFDVVWADNPKVREKAMKCHWNTPIYVDGYLYGCSGRNPPDADLRCIEWKTGKVVWNQDRGPGKESAAIVAADGHLYFRYQNAIMALIEATPDGYHEKGAFLLPSHNGESWSHPVIHGGRLYLRDQDNLLCYDLRQK